MSDLEILKELVHQDGLKASDKALIIIGTLSGPIKAEEIRSAARNAGLGFSFVTNLARALSATRGLAILTPEGWELLPKGREHLAKLGIDLGAKPTSHPLVELRRIIAPIAETDAGILAADALACLERGVRRPGVVCAWIGAVKILYDSVVQSKARLKAFNDDAVRRFGANNWKVAKNADDLARMSDANFLVVLESISMIGKNVKSDLEGCLKLRNACGHPTSLKLGEHRAAAHLDTLLNNVYTQFRPVSR